MGKVIKTEKELREVSYIYLESLIANMISISTILGVDPEPLFLDAISAIREHNKEVKNNLQKINNQNRMDLQ